MASMTVQQDAADFDLSVRFRIDNLRELLTDSAETEGVEVEPRMSNAFWPGFMFKVSRAIEGKQRKCRLSLYMLPGDYSTPTIAVYASVSVQSLLGNHTYSTKALKRQATFDHGRTTIGTLLSQKMYEASYTMQRENAAIVLVTLRSSNAPTPRSSPTLNLIHRVLTARPISNTRFIVFRRRDSTGRLSCPRAFYANMKDLASHYERCEDLLNIENSIEGFELPVGASLDDYSLTCDQHDYDSDFERDEEEDDEDDDIVVVQSENCRQRARRPLPGGTPADSMIADDSVTLESIQAEVEASMQSSTDSFDIINPREGVDLYSPSEFEGTTIVLLGAAARTWEALLYYLYTGFIDFAPLTSLNPKGQDEFLARYRSGNPHRPLPPSCRSIYRLAHMLELDGLRKLALEYLESQLTPETLLTEVFSEFTTRYDEVKEMELALVVRYWHALKASSAFKNKMVEVTSGSVPHAADIISEIMMRVSAQKA